MCNLCLYLKYSLRYIFLLFLFLFNININKLFFCNVLPKKFFFFLMFILNLIKFIINNKTKNEQLLFDFFEICWFFK